MDVGWLIYSCRGGTKAPNRHIGGFNEKRSLVDDKKRSTCINCSLSRRERKRLCQHLLFKIGANNVLETWQNSIFFHTPDAHVLVTSTMPHRIPARRALTFFTTLQASSSRTLSTCATSRLREKGYQTRSSTVHSEVRRFLRQVSVLCAPLCKNDRIQT